MKRYSRQREAILRLLKQDKTHPDAAQIYLKVKKEIPDISLGTVYRNLKQLRDDGEIIGFSAGDGFEHFDGNPKPHQHFCCKKCGKISDLYLSTDAVSAAAEQELKKSGCAEITDTEIFFYGICDSCKQSAYIN